MQLPESEVFDLQWDFGKDGINVLADNLHIATFVRCADGWELVCVLRVTPREVDELSRLLRVLNGEG